METLNKTTIFDSQVEKNMKQILEKIYNNAKGQTDIYKIIKIYSSFFLVEENRCKNKDALDLMKKTIEIKMKSGKL